MASLFGKGASSESEPDDLDDYEDDGEDTSEGPDALVLDLGPMGPPEHIKMLAEDVVGKDDAKVNALYEMMKAVLAEGEMPEEKSEGKGMGGMMGMGRKEMS